MRLAFLLLAVLPLCGCESLVFKLPTRQGNVIDQKEIDKVQVGMTREQVKFILGTPIAGSAFRDDRWDYVGYYRNPRGKVYNRTVTLFFEDNKVARLEGEKAPAAATEKTGAPDMDAIAKEEKKAATEEERAAETKDSGIVIKPKPKE